MLHDMGTAAQVVAAPGKKGPAAAEGAALVEVGPRACLMPIRIFAGSFGGPVLYENPAYVSPNKARNHAMAHQPLATAHSAGMSQSVQSPCSTSAHSKRSCHGMFAINK